MVYKDRNPRKFQVVTDSEKLAHLTKNYLLKQTFFLKHSVGNSVVKIEESVDNLDLLIQCGEELFDSIVIYKAFKKHMEVVCVVNDTRGPNKYIVSVREIRIAVEERANPRFDVSLEQVWINNARASRNTINASLLNIPTSVKIHFTKYEQLLANLADEVKVRIFDKPDEKLDLVRKTGKVFYIENTQDVMAYMPEDEEMFINYRDHIHVDIGEIMNAYKDKKIVSELIVPIIFVDIDGKDIALGYIQLLSKTKTIDTMMILDVKAKTFEMVDRIRDANTMIINSKQEIINISKAGLRAKITEPELKQFLQHRAGFSFDIIFKLQQPITVFCEIIYTAIDDNNDLIIGIKYLGKSSRQGEWERLLTLVDSLQKK